MAPSPLSSYRSISFFFVSSLCFSLTVASPTLVRPLYVSGSEFQPAIMPDTCHCLSHHKCACVNVTTTMSVFA